VNISVTTERLLITGWDTDLVRVRLVGSPQPFRIDVRSSVAVIEPDSPGRGGGGALEITVPLGSRISARSVHGAIIVRNVHGTVDVSSESGDIAVNDVAGEVHLGSVSGAIVAAHLVGAVDVSSVQGNVTLDHAKGKFTIATVSGDVKLRNASASFVRAQSTDGDLRYAGNVESSGAYTLSTHAGDVQFSVPASVSAVFTVATWSGEVESDFVMAAPSSGRRLTFRVGSGGAQISLETFSGDIGINVLDRLGRE
jgi:DUF4097 and DUF4098 domain-containing protein YvlB